MLENPIWFYKDGNKIYKIHAVGRKIIHHLINPEYNIHVNEVGGNTSKNDVSHIGSMKFITAPDIIKKT